LLLAAAALPLAPSLAQESAGTQEQAAEAAETPAPAEKAASQPVTIDAPEAPAGTEEPVEAEAQPAPAATRPAERTTAPAAPPASVIIVREPALPTDVGTMPPPGIETLPPPVSADALTTEVLPEPPPVETPLAAGGVGIRQESRGTSPFVWLVAGLLLGAVLAAAFFLLRRRRRSTVYHERHEEAHAPEPVRAIPAAAAPVAPAAVAAVPLAAAPLGAVLGAEDRQPREAIETAAPVPTAASGHPQLDIIVRPVRAGVTSADARVEFELAVENQGTAPAENVRISAWMFSEGAESSEAERALIEGAERASLPETTIEPGGGRRIDTAVTLPTRSIGTDTLIPVVVAEARYRLPDGSEGRTSARFAVGLPDGEELARFAVDRPTGLHEGVEARPLGEVERA
jgi:hypothetical protein